MATISYPNQLSGSWTVIGNSVVWGTPQWSLFPVGCSPEELYSIMDEIREHVEDHPALDALADMVIVLERVRYYYNIRDASMMQSVQAYPNINTAQWSNNAISLNITTSSTGSSSNLFGF